MNPEGQRDHRNQLTFSLIVMPNMGTWKKGFLPIKGTDSHLFDTYQNFHLSSLTHHRGKEKREEKEKTEEREKRERREREERENGKERKRRERRKREREKKEREREKKTEERRK